MFPKGGVRRNQGGCVPAWSSLTLGPLYSLIRNGRIKYSSPKKRSLFFIGDFFVPGGLSEVIIF